MFALHSVLLRRRWLLPRTPAVNQLLQSSRQKPLYSWFITRWWRSQLLKHLSYCRYRLLHIKGPRAMSIALCCNGKVSWKWQFSAEQNMTVQRRHNVGKLIFKHHYWTLFYHWNSTGLPETSTLISGCGKDWLIPVFPETALNCKATFYAFIQYFYLSLYAKCNMTVFNNSKATVFSGKITKTGATFSAPVRLD